MFSGSLRLIFAVLTLAVLSTVVRRAFIELQHIRNLICSSRTDLPLSGTHKSKKLHRLPASLTYQ